MGRIMTLDFNIEKEFKNEVESLIADLKLQKHYEALVRNDVEFHYMVSGEAEGVNQLTQYLSRYNQNNNHNREKQ